MKIRSIRELKNLKNKRVILRVDFNVPISENGHVNHSEDYRIVESLLTIKYLIKQKAKIIILAHLGRPDGKINELLRLDPVAVRLSQLLKKDICKSDAIFSQENDSYINDMSGGEIFMLENIRFDKREEKADKKMAQALAKLGDIYVNDAFAVCHRDQSSVSVIQDYLPTYAGFLLEKELKNLSTVMNNPLKPLTVIIGGAKISTKIQLIKRFLKISDHVLLGGALANTVLHVMGVSVGKSLVEPKMYSTIKKIKLTDNQLRVPVDGVMAKSYQAKTGRLDALADVKKDELILDIGPDTIKLYEKIINSSKMIVWNGPMGLVETPFFSQGTESLIRILAKTKAYTVVGGGESVQVIRRLNLDKKFNFISTGGGAMLEFLEGKRLPGLKKILLTNK